MFVYCNNNPISFCDPCGLESRPVGAGVQLEVDIGQACVGIEVIIYWDVDECDGGAPVIAMYVYGGISVDVNDAYIASILGMITDNASLLLDETGAGAMVLASMISDNFSVSVSGLLVVGNEAFNSTTSYEESFTSVGGSWGKVRGSVAYSETCTAYSVGGNLVGGTNILPSWGVSKTYYQQISLIRVPNNKKSAGYSSTLGGVGLWHTTSSLSKPYQLSR